MIWLTKLDGSPIMLNDDQITFVEVIHDTIIRGADGELYKAVATSPHEGRCPQPAKRRPKHRALELDTYTAAVRSWQQGWGA